MVMPLLGIKDLMVTLKDDQKKKVIVDHVTLNVDPKMILALVGGSGSGKTTIGLAILRLLSSALSVDQGEIVFNGEDLLKNTESQMQKIRGRSIGMIFQEPLFAFNPVFRIGYQIDEVLDTHFNWPISKRKKRILELLRSSGILEPDRVAQSYPHQLSGGMRQRAMIAQAMAGEPSLIIADEPTSNLDVTIQAGIMDLFRNLKKEFGLSILLITHDLGMVSHLSDEIAVMSSGKIIESGPVNKIMNHPQHPYTQKLVSI